MNKGEVVKIVSENLKVAITNHELGGGTQLKTKEIKSFGIIERFDCVTSQLPKSRFNKVTNEFVPVLDDDGKEILQNITYPVVTGTVNGKAGSTIPLSPILRGQSFVGALNETQLASLTETFAQERPVYYQEIGSRKMLWTEKPVDDDAAKAEKAEKAKAAKAEKAAKA